VQEGCAGAHQRTLQPAQHTPPRSSSALRRLVAVAGENARLVRVMPNTPCLVGETAAAMCLGGQVRAPVPPHSHAPTSSTSKCALGPTRPAW